MQTVSRRDSALAKICYVLATGFGVGHAPVAPGTFGTLLAIPVYLLMRPLPLATYVAVVVVLFAIGVAVCAYAERRVAHDAPVIVWDEVVGYLVTMTLAPPGWFGVVAGFVLFRLFDIWKPFPIRMLDRRVAGGFGTMLDDAVAGLYAFLALQMLLLASWVVMPAAAGIPFFR